MSRVWPSISRDSRMSELRSRSSISRTSARSAGGLRNHSTASSGKDVLGPMASEAHRPVHARKPVNQLDTVYSVEPGASGDLGYPASKDGRV